jgi:plasmid stability protein
MPVSLSIKNVPDDIAEKLRGRAARRHRSLQGELLAILEESVAPERTVTPLEFTQYLKASELKTPAESAKFVREDRDARRRR